jgi:hypothetical protein
VKIESDVFRWEKVVGCDGVNSEFYPLSTEETELRENGWMTAYTKNAIGP